MQDSTNSPLSTVELRAIIQQQARTIKRLEATIAKLNKKIAKQEEQLAQQCATTEELKGKISELQTDVSQKQLRIEGLTKELYGKSSEKSGKGKNKDKPKKDRSKKERRTGSRSGFSDEEDTNKDKDFSHLPKIEEVVSNIPDGENPEDYKFIGEKRVERLATLPAQHYVLVTVYKTYKKKSNGYIPPRQNEHPLGKCAADISFIVSAITKKILFHIPFYRYEQILSLQKIECGRSNLVRWSERFADLLEPINAAILSDIKSAAVVYGDESPVIARLENEDKSKEYKKTYFWNLIAPDRGAYFYWSDKRNNQEAQKLLAGVKGTFVSDALGIYTTATAKLSLTWQICWIHIRRNFIKATANKELSKEALLAINTILAIDKAIRRRTKKDDEKLLEKRYHYRKRFLMPLVEKMRLWISSNINLPAVQTDKDTLKAFEYINMRWEEANCFITNPLVLPHNNLSEQHFRFLKLGAKNWTFCSSECGARTLGILYTLVYSAKLLRINPSIYLTDLIEQISIKGVKAQDLVPRRWKEAREEIATKAYFSHLEKFAQPKQQ
jgi:transposase/uncharacterized coiled-coil protein SlyX